MTNEASKPFLSSQEQWAANDNDDNDYASKRLGSSSNNNNNTAAADPPPTDVAWAVAFKINVAITVLSVRLQYQPAVGVWETGRVCWVVFLSFTCSIYVVLVNVNVSEHSFVHVLVLHTRVICTSSIIHLYE